MPGPEELPARLDAVLTVIHLLYTTGHAAPSGAALTRADPADRALDLARMVVALLPGDREAQGLLALLVVNHARRATRTDDDGRLVLLEDQDRSAWDRAAIEEGHRLVVAALEGGPPGRFALQAAIAAAARAGPSYADDRLAADRDALRRAAADLAVARSWRSTGRSRSRWSRARRRAWRRSRRWRPRAGWRATATCRRQRPTCCGGWAGGRGRRRLPRGAPLADNDAERAFLERRLAECEG